jgi:hypothetical protein
MNPANGHLKYRTLRPRPADQLLSTEAWSSGSLYPAYGPYDNTGTTPVFRTAQVGYFSIPGDRLDSYAGGGDVGGDVKNLAGGTGYSISGTTPGTNDSIWLDLGSPIRTMPDGTMYKPLYAPLIIDLDSHLNINAHGNMANLRGLDATNTVPTIGHYSNQGWGPWEVNLSTVLEGPNNEWTNLFLGNSTQTIHGRYGTGLAARPTVPQALMGQPGTTPHFYSQTDVDGVDMFQPSGTATTKIMDPSAMGPSGTTPWPTFASGPGGWDNSSTTPSGELVEHPGMFNYFQPTFTGAPPGHRTFDPSNLRAMIRDLSTRAELNNSDVGQLVGNSFNSPPFVQPRLWLTTHSFDVDQPGVTPWLTTDNATITYACPSLASAPVGGQVGYPDLANRLQPVLPWTGDNGEFRFTDWRAIGAALGRVDLNRRLPSYPSYASSGAITGASIASQTSPIVITSNGHGLATGQQVTIVGVTGNTAANGTRTITVVDANNFSLNGSIGSMTTTGYTSGGTWTASPLTTNSYDRYDDSSNPNSGLIKQAFLNAQAARQQLAQDIYIRFLYATLGLTSNPPWAAGAGVTYPASTPPSNLQALRWLAQLAVNIVDYIDEDDISTPFDFYNDGAGGHSFWVFGTEMPHIVLNEGLSECAIPASAGTYYNRFWVELYNPFVSPPASAVQADGQPVQLNIAALSGTSANTNPDAPHPANSYPPYQIVIAPQGLAPTQLPTPGQAYSTTTNDIVLGSLDYSLDPTSTVPSLVRVHTDIASDPTVPPGDFDPSSTSITLTKVGGGPGATNTIGTQQYFLLGPPNTAAPQGPADTQLNAINAGGPGANWIQTPHMTYSVAYDPTSTSPSTPPETNATIALRRLANPHIPFDPYPAYISGPLTGQTNAWYNPYVTVDYLDLLPINNTNAANFSTNGDASLGKREPYASLMDTTGTTPTTGYASTSTTSEIVQQNAGSTQTKCTFGGPNSPLDTNFPWLVHHDRNLTSPMELLQVSGYQPWQLTHAFVQNKSGVLTPWSHRVPWFDEDLASPSTTSHRLYRALEFFKTHSLAAGVEGTGRIPGKVNLNTLFDNAMFDPTSTAPVFQALCDPNTSNNFAQSDVAAAWINLEKLRSDEWTTIGTAPVNPYGSIAVGFGGTSLQYPNGTSIDNTLLASIAPGTPGATRILQATTSLPTGTNPAGTNPVYSDQIMSKIANQVTNRSHVFAVYLTVGFFRVLTDPALPPGQNTTLPVKLAGEIGARNTPPTNIRHHMFAIVDRSALTQLRIPQAFPGAQTNATLTTNIAPVGSQLVTATLPVGALQDSSNPPLWKIDIGTRLLVDTGNNQEIVTVTGVNALSSPPSFTANFANPHNAGTIAVAVPVESDFDPASGGVQTVTGTTTTSTPGTAIVTMTGMQELTRLVQPGSQLFVDAFPNQEVVTVSSIESTNTFTASFARRHAATFNIFIPIPNAHATTTVASGPDTVTVDFMSSDPTPPGQPSLPHQAVAWRIQPGSIITVDTGSNQETVQVSAVDTENKNFTATFNKAHQAGFGIYLPKFANPGPQPNFSVRDNSAVVLYAAVID